MSFPREGEKTLDIAALDWCTGYSYSECVIARNIAINAAHINGRHPVNGLGQDKIYMMKCIPLLNPVDLKPLIRIAIHVITPSEEVDEEYSEVKFCLAPDEPGSKGAYLLIGLSPSFGTHMCLRDILLVQLDSVALETRILHFFFLTELKWVS